MRKEVICLLLFCINFYTGRISATGDIVKLSYHGNVIYKHIYGGSNGKGFTNGSVFF